MSKVFRLLALDPGLTIGFASFVMDVETFQLKELVVSEERTEDAKPWGTAPMNIIVNGIDYLVMEDYIGGGPRTKESNYVLRQIGGFESVAASKGIPLKMQINAMRRPFLKEGAAFYKALKGRPACHHGKDALAHGLRWLQDEKQWDFRRWLCDF